MSLRRRRIQWVVLGVAIGLAFRPLRCKTRKTLDWIDLSAEGGWEWLP